MLVDGWDSSSFVAFGPIIRPSVLATTYRLLSALYCSGESGAERHSVRGDEGDVSLSLASLGASGTGWNLKVQHHT